LTGMKHNITDLGIPAESELRGIGIKCLRKTHTTSQEVTFRVA
jgi:hypothetical protein